MTFYFAIPFLPGGNLEWIIIVMAALMIFGSNLPEVALRAVAHVMRFRRAVAKMWRDTGLEDELRRVRRDIEMSIPREADFDVKEPLSKAVQSNDARAAAERARETAERSARSTLPGGEAGLDGDSVDPDAHRSDTHRSGGFRIEPADGTVAAGDWDPEPTPEPTQEAASLDPAVRDRTPGTDRQEPTSYEFEPEEEPGPEPEAPEPDPEDDFGGSHFGAGVRGPSSQP